MEVLDLGYWKQAILDLAEAVEKQKEHLCELDGAIGDGDHGASMARGLQDAASRVSAEHFSDIGELLRMVGTTFVGSVGGVTGIVFGTMFVSAGKGAEGKREIGIDGLAAMFRLALEGTKDRGKAAEGDKSMVDALSPAVRALEAAAAIGLNPSEALALAAKSALEGMETTRNMVAKVGRARYQGANAIGHVDAGAASIAIIFETLATTADRRYKDVIG